MGTRSTRQPGRLSASLATVLHEAFNAEGITQGVLETQTGISQSQLSKFLRGERAMTIDELDIVCVALHLCIGDVVTEAKRRISAP